MAQAMIMNSKLRLVVETGMDEKGQPIHKPKTYNNIRKDATADQLFQAANALASLCQHLLVGVERTDNFEIIA
ncbi:DUF1659 domain-containing protein [Cytobacillus sp. FJAT-54145]|uniref:DUF1659 domain-containing protein n=1 Tax=Cytobacillus spartinae TaxID=3299023 RepID=A0ABW6K4W2_9BACI